MQRKIEGQRLVKVWIERIVWNAAATAALAMMIGILLCSLRLLDQINPEAENHRAAIAPQAEAARDRPIESRSTRVARANGPSG